MKKISLMIMSIIFLLSIGNIKLYADDISNYIIMGNIAPYERLTKTIDPLTEELKTIPGYWIYRNSGVLMGADHFLADHKDVTYKTKYQSEALDMGMSVEVTQHTGGDSDRWLLHEVDADFRNGYGIPGQAYGQRKINGQSILEAGYRIYRWLSGNKVIDIEYTADDQLKPEPLEVVQAYLAKHPSTITPMTLKQLRSGEKVTTWIKDEMDRRLWLCDKWNLQYQAGKVTQTDLLPKLRESMTIFLNYRQKYFKISAEDESNTLRSYLQNSDTAGFQTKITEYKTWWNANKGKSITLP